MALDLASVVTTHLTAGGLALAETINPFDPLQRYAWRENARCAMSVR